MRSVIITRPLGNNTQTDALTQRLAQAGLTLYHLPTLTLTTLQSAPDEAHIRQRWPHYTLTMLVSQNAAHFAQQHMARLGLNWSPNTWLASVGQGTLCTLQQLWPQHTRFIHPDRTDTQDSEGLWRAISAHTELQTPQNLLIIRAEHGRDALLQQAQQAGWHTDIWRCYQRSLRQWSADELTQFEQACAAHSLLLITSIEGLDALMTQLNPAQRLATQAQTLITLHPRIAEHARQSGFSDVHEYTPSELAQGIIELAQ